MILTPFLLKSVTETLASKPSWKNILHFWTMRHYGCYMLQHHWTIYSIGKFFQISPVINIYLIRCICLTLSWRCGRDLLVHKFRVASVFTSLIVEMEAFIVTISASLLIIVLITSNVVAGKLSMESKNGKIQTIF